MKVDGITWHAVTLDESAFAAAKQQSLHFSACETVAARGVVARPMRRES